MFPQFMTMQEKQMLAKTVRIHKQIVGNYVFSEIIK